MDIINPFLQETIYDAGTKTFTFKADVTEYAHTNTSYEGENNYYDFTWEGNVVLSCGDYGANDRSYAIKVDSTPGLVLSQTSALLHPGENFELSVNDNTGTDTELTRTSSDTSVATIDEYGNVVAVAPGQTIITVSDGTSSAICIVAVEEWPTDVIDFKLSVDNVEGLKTKGQATVKVVDLYPADVEIDSLIWEVSEDDDYAEYAEGLISVEKASSDGLTGTLYLTASASEVELPAGHAVLTVTINGVSRSTDVSWDAIPTASDQDDLISGALYEEQVLYTTVDEPINVVARYKQSSMHEVGEVLFDCENDGLVLDGPMFFNIGGKYSAKLVNKEGFALPEDIKIYTVYSEDYEYQSYPGYSGITYDSSTGEINIPYAPYGATNKLRIVADGLVSDGNPAGILSGITYETPDNLYGPFSWTVSDSENTTLTPVVVSKDGTTHEEMQFSSSKDGVYYVTATSKTNEYSVQFAVVVEPVRVEKIALESHDLDVACNSEKQVEVTLSPEPTNSESGDYGKLVWKSFNEDVATVDDNGVVTGVSLGKAYVKVSSVTNTKVSNFLIVNVTPQGVRFVDDNDEVIKESSKTPEELTESDYPTPPVKEGHKFVEWVSSEDPKTGLTTYKATYEVLKYTVTFTADGTTVKTLEKEYGSTLSEADYPAVPSKEGYTGVWEVNNFPIKSDIELCAKYTALPVEVKDGWVKEDDTWYCYDNGVKKTGWLQEDGTWYYLKKDGSMAVGWIEDGGSWYFLYGNGAMATGWTKLGNTWYYMYDSGAMATGWVKSGNDWYYLYDNGAMATGWINDGGVWYYLYGNGAMATDHWAGNYYLQKDGSMATNKWIGQWYVGADGAWVKGKKK